MSESASRPQESGPAPQAAPVIHVAPSPHVFSRSLTTRRMMLDVLIALAPVVGMSIGLFGLFAIRQLVICIAACMVAEALFAALRRRPRSLGDGSAAVTGVILALSLPGTAPWYVGVVGSFVAIGLGKAVFGGLGYNLFNPAMVGRAFVMICFASAMGAEAYVAASAAGAPTDAITQATPLTTAFATVAPKVTPLWKLLIGYKNGCLGEIPISCLIGGLYLCIRRTASWEIPFGAIVGAAIVAGVANLTDLGADWTILHHLLGGALLFGAFFIATDPVTSPLTPTGKLIFGAGVGVLVMLIRIFSSWPEGVMFSVLLMNAVVPLINRWAIPRPVGGPIPAKR